MSNLENQLRKWEPFTRHISWLNCKIQDCLRLISLRISPDPNVLRIFCNFLKPYQEHDYFASRTIATLEFYLVSFPPL